MGKKVREMAMSNRGVLRMPGGPEWLQVGGRVELRSDEEGYAGAWFEVEIGGLYPSSKQAFVKYVHFVDEDTGAAVQEFARVDNLRPLPPKVPPTRVWRPRASVETHYKNAWWVGYIKQRVESNSSKYLVFYGLGEQDLEISYHHIRPRHNYAFPSPHDPSGSWTRARSMQNPATWERADGAPTVAKLQPRKGATHAAVAKVQPRRVSGPASDGDESDGSWDVREGARKKRKSVSAIKSTPSPSVEPKRRSRSVEPTRKIRFVQRHPALTITHALPAVRAEQQSTLVLTPGSSPPPPFQDCAVSPNSDSKAQLTRSNSRSSSGSGTSNAASDEEDEDEDEVIFPDLSINEQVRHRKAYHEILVCFRNDSKGILDNQRHNILTVLRAELKLTSKDVNDAHCAVFGMPGM